MEEIIKIGEHSYLTIDFGAKYYMNLRDLDVSDFNREGYERVACELDLKYHTLSLTKQVHGTNVEIIEGNKTYKDTDGIIGGVGDLLIIRTADCFPILLYDDKMQKIALIHSGWRGTLNKISEQALLKMKLLGSNIRDIKVYVGAGISKEAFEVRRDVIDILHKNFSNIKDVYRRVSKEKYLLDIKEVLIRNLLANGIKEKNIYVSNYCTYTNPLFHSYRRDKEEYGLMASFALLED